MTQTTNLMLTLLEQGQLQPEVTINNDLQIIDSLAGPAIQFGYKQATTTGLTFGYYGGRVYSNGSNVTIADGTIGLTASTTNYVQRTAAGTVSVNTTGYTTGLIPMATVVTGASSITTVTDTRPAASDLRGAQSIAVSNANITLTDAQVNCRILRFTGTLTANVVVTLPAYQQEWVMSNATTGTFTLTVKTASGTGVIVAQGYSAVLFCDGVNVSAATDAQMADHLAASDPHPQYATDTDLTAHTGASSGAHAASAISYAGSPNLAATNVEDGLDELGARKLNTADLFSDFVVSGLLGAVPSTASLTMTTPGGVAYVNGTRVNKASADADLAYTYPASATTYDYLADTGAITHGTSATPPAGAIVLQAVTTDASAITGVKDRRPFPASDIGARAFLDVSGTGTGQTIANAFTTISLPTVNADPGGNYNASTFIYTVPRDGLYMIVTQLRFADAITAGLSYGQGAHTSNVDGPWFLWNSTNGKREGLINTRIMRLLAGDAVRAYAYMDSTTAQTVAGASMNIGFLSR